MMLYATGIRGEVMADETLAKLVDLLYMAMLEYSAAIRARDTFVPDTGSMTVADIVRIRHNADRRVHVAERNLEFLQTRLSRAMDSADDTTTGGPEGGTNHDQ